MAKLFVRIHMFWFFISENQRRLAVKNSGNSSFAQDSFLVALRLRQPMFTDGHALRFAVMVPNRAERQRLGFFLQREARGEISARFRRAYERGFQQRDEQ